MPVINEFKFVQRRMELLALVIISWILSQSYQILNIVEILTR